MSTSIENNRERQRRWYWNHKEHKNKINKDKYHEFVRTGMCPICSGKNESRTEGPLCTECLEKRKVKKR